MTAIEWRLRKKSLRRKIVFSKSRRVNTACMSEFTVFTNVREHRCRSRQILGGAKDFCPNFPDFWTTSCTNIFSWRPFLGWPPKRSSCNKFCTRWAPFFWNRSTCAPFLPVLAGSLPRFRDFTRIFTKSKLLGVRLHLLHTTARATSTVMQGWNRNGWTLCIKTTNDAIINIILEHFFWDFHWNDQKHANVQVLYQNAEKCRTLTNVGTTFSCVLPGCNPVFPPPLFYRIARQ